MSSILSNILNHVKDECNTCNLQMEDITDRQIALVCDSDPITATFRALMLGDPTENELVTTNIEKWVEAKGDLDLGDFTVKLNSECRVVINSFGEDLCTVQSTPTTPGSPTTDPSSNNTAAIIIPIVIIIIIVIAAIVVLVVVILLFRRQHQTQKTDPYLNFDEQETEGTARLSQTLYEPAESREYDNPMYGEQEDVVKTDLEREYLEDPSILK